MPLCSMPRPTTFFISTVQCSPQMPIPPYMSFTIQMPEPPPLSPSTPFILGVVSC